jgi:hypothetical protein
MTPRQLCDAIESRYGTGTASLKHLEACLAGRTPAEISAVWPELATSTIAPTPAEINAAIRRTHQARQETVQDKRVAEILAMTRETLRHKGCHV